MICLALIAIDVCAQQELKLLQRKLDKQEMGLSHPPNDAAKERKSVRGKFPIENRMAALQDVDSSAVKDEIFDGLKNRLGVQCLTFCFVCRRCQRSRWRQCRREKRLGGRTRGVVSGCCVRSVPKKLIQHRKHKAEHRLKEYEKLREELLTIQKELANRKAQSISDDDVRSSPLFAALQRETHALIRQHERKKEQLQTLAAEFSEYKKKRQAADEQLAVLSLL